ncbi:MAG: hypothetical protein HDS78_03285 [Bacteroidales bacterium]|nr:hypothetical protein [Bacteroidales bacterium]
MTRTLKYLLTFLTVLGLSAPATGSRISADEAQKRAESFSRQASALSRSASELTLAYSEGNYYVFNKTDGGFVVVSASDLTDDIIGYSRDGQFDESGLPDNFAYFLRSFSDQIEYAEQNNIFCKSVKSRSDDERENIAPMIKTRWNQFYPYNAHCPEIDGARTLTGCVATAMAQIMAYHRYPEQGSGTHTYEKNGIERSIMVDTCKLDYDNMLLWYEPVAGLTDTPREVAAVASLMKVCGYTCWMDYGLTFSGAYVSNIGYALANYFGYSPDYEYATSWNYESDEAWEEDIYDSLKNYGPVAYSGGNHAWVCDGYEDGFFSMNWGWSGYCNGFYKLDALIADNKNYTWAQEAVIRIKPEREYEKEVLHIRPKTDVVHLNNQVLVRMSNLNIGEGEFSFGFLAVNERNDSIVVGHRDFRLECGEEFHLWLNADDIKSWNLEYGLYCVTPAFLTDGSYTAPNYAMTPIYVGVTPSEVMVSDDKEKVQAMIDDTYASIFSVTTHSNRRITIDAINNNYPVQVFDFGGKMIYSGYGPEIMLPKSGFYIVTNGQSTASFVIK